MPDALRAISDVLPVTYADDALGKIAADEVDGRFWLDVAVIGGPSRCASSSARPPCAGARAEAGRSRRELRLVRAGPSGAAKASRALPLLGEGGAVLRAQRCERPDAAERGRRRRTVSRSTRPS